MPIRPLNALLRRYQSREGWRRELRAILARARQEGDERSGMTILSDWLAFRRRYTGEDTHDH